MDLIWHYIWQYEDLCKSSRVLLDDGQGSVDEQHELVHLRMRAILHMFLLTLLVIIPAVLFVVRWILRRLEKLLPREEASVRPQY